jgi:hypothetical protein
MVSRAGVERAAVFLARDDSSCRWRHFYVGTEVATAPLSVSLTSPAHFLAAGSYVADSCLGAVMAHPSTSQSLAPSWPSYVVLALLIVQLLVSIWVVWMMRDYRWFSAFTVALEQWFGLACAFVAGMSVTGDWL